MLCWLQENRFPCPFLELSQESSDDEGAAAAQEQQAPGTGGSSELFSFMAAPPPSAHKPSASSAPPAVQAIGVGSAGGTAATPVAWGPRQQAGPAGRLSTAVARRAAAAAGGLQRWVPSLSPLVSEGALTPGALARLSPLSALKPSSRVLGLRSVGSTPRAGTPADDACSPMSADGAAGTEPGTRLRQRGRQSGDSKGEGGWRLSRRDMISPDSDALARE